MFGIGMLIDAGPTTLNFQSVVDSIRSKIEDDSTVVDVELHFKHIDISKKALFVKKNNQSSTELRLPVATRKRLRELLGQSDVRSRVDPG